MIGHGWKVGVVMATALVSLASAGPAWGGQKTHHKAQGVISGIAACPSAAALSAAAHLSYTGPTTGQVYEKDWVACQYNSQGKDALDVNLCTRDDPLRIVSANAANAADTPTRIRGIGSAASHCLTEVFVHQRSARSFSVIDQLSELTLKQTEAVARAVVVAAGG